MQVIDLTNSEDSFEVDNDVICLDVSLPEVIETIQVITVPDATTSSTLLNDEKKEGKSFVEKISVSTQTEKLILCGVCLEDLIKVRNSDMEEIVSTICGHLFCRRCIMTAISVFHKCPVCRKRLGVKSFHPIFF
ncbi:uncharacterized protein LOC129217581 [Uloborus diversus]|uniref:uncharacterized protein LOC129217581 n=1 Tax=Uloborus diversus TaxID=327109 RepID=UPI00240A489C|nr:uncharacterized protein LOC129217581 [Uloborus diversus]